MKRTRTIAVLASAIALGNLAGCGGGNSPSSDFAGEPYAAATTIRGDVRADGRAVPEGHLEVFDFKGQRVGELQWHNSEAFLLNLPAGTLYPILVTAHPKGSGLLKLVMVRPEPDKVSVSERSTAIADKATQLGGLTPDNVMAATLDGTGPANPMGGGPHGESTQHYGGWH